ncbi:MAG: NTP transferase domain-containing protein [Bacteroidales bacterium]|nr:NTP transferase domain-containing protein [Bacteroidales bacterium]
MQTRKAFVLAAGLGTRLRPLTDARPKALVEVGGKPLIYHILKKLQSSGYDDITVNVHHFAAMLAEYLGREFPEVHISDESDCLLDTGGGILRARRFLEGHHFLVHNVDIFSNLDLRAIPEEDAVATLVVSERESSRHLLFDGDMNLAGWVDERTGEVRSPYGALDPAKYRRLAFSGIHLVSDEIFPLLEKYGFSGRFSIIDAYLRLCAEHCIRGFIPENFRILDIGKIDALDRAPEFL